MNLLKRTKMTIHTIDDNPKYICFDCIKEEFLSSEIETQGRRRKCSFCKKVQKTYLVSDIADRVENVMLSFYERTRQHPTSWEERLQGDDESNYNWEREGSTLTDILQNEFDFTLKAAKHVSEILSEKYWDMDAAQIDEETEFSMDAQYQLKKIGHGNWLKEWDEFKHILRSEARFFNERVSNILHSIFKDIEKTATWGSIPVVATIGPGSDITKIYRARIFLSDVKLHGALKRPELQLGPPPLDVATNGRMNAQGVSVFYGSVDEETAIAEVRPPVGCKLATAAFNIIRTLQLLDLRALENATGRVSVFSPEYQEIMEKSAFLSELSRKITQPVMPGDEALEYLPTQAVADYLASRTDVIFDGIIFPSVQVSGKNKTNIVLFNKSSRVDTLVHPEGAEVEVYNTDYFENEEYVAYRVVEKFLKLPPKKTNKAKYPDPDLRAPALSIDLESIKVHFIQGVSFTKQAHSVAWEQFEMEDYANFSDSLPSAPEQTF